MGLQSWFSCAAHTLQHPHPSGTVLTPGGQTRGSLGHSHTAGQLAVTWREQRGRLFLEKAQMIWVMQHFLTAKRNCTALVKQLHTHRVLDRKIQTHNRFQGGSVHKFQLFLQHQSAGTFIFDSVLSLMLPRVCDWFWILLQTVVRLHVSQVTAGQSALSV